MSSPPSHAALNTAPMPFPAPRPGRSCSPRRTRSSISPTAPRWPRSICSRGWPPPASDARRSARRSWISIKRSASSGSSAICASRTRSGPPSAGPSGLGSSTPAARRADHCHPAGVHPARPAPARGDSRGPGRINGVSSFFGENKWCQFFFRRINGVSSFFGAEK